MRLHASHCFLLAGLFLITSGLYSQNNTSSWISGEWDWAYTKGEENGEKYHVTPKSMSISVTYHFDSENVQIFINDNLNEAYSYHFMGDTLRYGQEEVLYRFSKNKDSLIMTNVHCCKDIFEKVFVRDIGK